MSRTRAVIVAAVLVMALAGCTGGEDPAVPSAQGTPTSGAPPAGELEFVACMRAQGIANMPDPVPGDTSGRSSVRYAIDVLGMGSDGAFQAALDECLRLLPAPEPGQQPTDQQEALLAYAQCMREHGLPEFPDPVDGHLGIWYVYGDGSAALEVFDNGLGSLDLNAPVAAAATQACAELAPAND